jgi:hypothetical protein
VLHARGAAGTGPALLERVRGALAGVVAPGDVQPVAPSLEDVFVLAGGEEAA